MMSIKLVVKKTMIIFTVVICAAAAGPQTAMAATGNTETTVALGTTDNPAIGFVATEKGIVWQYADGSVLKNDMLEQDGLKWYFDAEGIAQTGMVTFGGNTYYLYENGLYAKSWQRIDDEIFYFNPDGTMLKNGWVEQDGLKWHFDTNGKLQTGVVKIGKKTYYLNADGICTTGWRQIDDGIYYFNLDGSMAQNTTIDGYKLDKDGKVVFTPAQIAASSHATAAQIENENHDLLSQTKLSQLPANGKVDVVVPEGGNQALANVVSGILSQIVTEDMTDTQKLLACYDYVIEVTSYKRTYEKPTGDFTGQYAMDIFSTHLGNCFRYASAFAYLAKGLGFDATVVTGQIHAARGGLTPHGWAIITIDGVEYIVDPDMADAKPAYKDSMFMATYESYPVKPLVPEAVHAVHF